MRSGRGRGRGRIGGYVCHFAKDLLAGKRGRNLNSWVAAGNKSDRQDRTQVQGGKWDCPVSSVGQGPESVSGGCP